MNTQRLAGLDALRGIAALVVVVSHALAAAELPEVLPGGLAVDLFFMLSGYVMARCYEVRLGSDLSALRFMRLRLRRLWPTIALGAAVGLLLHGANLPPAMATLFFACSLLVVPVLVPGVSAFPLNGALWSMFFEIFANLAHAMALRRFGNVALLVLVAAGGLLLVIFQTVANPGGSADSFLIGFPRVLFDYGLGIVLYRWLADRAVLPFWIAPCVLFAGLLFAGAHPGALWPQWLFMAAAVPVCVIAGLSTTPLPRVSNFLGRLSFPLYAVHMPVVYCATWAGAGVVLSITAGIVAGLVAMWLTEVHVTSRKHRLSRYSA